MRKLILFFITFTIVSLFSWHSFSWSSEIKTLADFSNSSFMKKYSPLKMESWPLKTGGYSNSFYIDLKIDKNSLVLMEILTKNQNNPVIYRYSMIFHVGYTKQMKTFLNDFITSIDSTLNSKTVTDYIQKQASVKLRKSSDASKKTFGKYSFRVSNVLNSVTVRIEKE